MVGAFIVAFALDEDFCQASTSSALKVPINTRTTSGRGLPLNSARFKNSVSMAFWLPVALVNCYISFFFFRCSHSLDI